MRFLVPLLVAFPFSLAAQSPVPPAEPTPIQISPQEALAHRIGHDKPAYPRFALAAGVTGTVRFSAVIGPDGLIRQLAVGGGPPSLVSSAQTWLAAGKFRPFLRDGQPVTVSTTLPVGFALPPGAHAAHPLAALYQRNITSTVEREGPDSPPRARWSTLSPAMHDWLARYQAAVTYFDSPAASQSFDNVLAAQHSPPPLIQTPGNIALYPLRLAVPKHRFYLLFEFSHGCAKSDCPIFLLDESLSAVSIAVSARGTEVDLHRRPDSPYPDLLFWSDSAQAGISNINGFSYYGGQWDQLYCGTDDAAEDSELDDESVEHHGARVPRPPLATLCK